MPDDSQTYRLQSAPLLHTPGFMAGMRQNFLHGKPKDRFWTLTTLITGFPSLPAGLILTYLGGDEEWVADYTWLEDTSGENDTLCIKWSPDDMQTVDLDEFFK